jgi:hypothetical protein
VRPKAQIIKHPANRSTPVSEVQEGVTSVVTSKPANSGHLKTGQWIGPVMVPFACSSQAWRAVALERAPNDLRQLDERFVPGWRVASESRNRVTVAAPSLGSVELRG